MNCNVISQCLEGTADVSSFVQVDSIDTSCAIGIHVSGGVGTGSVKVVGTQNLGHFNQYFGNTKNELFGTESLDVTSYWSAARMTVTTKSGSLPWSKSSTYFELEGTAGAGSAPTLSTRYQDNNYLPADVSEGNVFSCYVKQHETEALAASSIKLALFNLDGDVVADRQHSIRFAFPTYGGAPELQEDADALLQMSFSSIDSVGSGWYRLTVGIKASDFLTGSPQNEQDNDRLLATLYLGTDGDTASFQSKKIYVAQPQAEYSDPVNPNSTRYFPVFTTDKYNFDILPVVYEDSSLAADSNTVVRIPSYPAYQVSLTNLSTTDANIKVYLIHNIF